MALSRKKQRAAQRSTGDRMRARDRKNHGQSHARLPATGAPRAAASAVPAPQAIAASACASACASSTASITTTEPDLALPDGLVMPTGTVTIGTCPPPLDEPVDIKPLDDHWCQWISDAALRRTPVDELIATVAAAGIDAAQASGFIAGLPRNPMFRSAERLRERYERYARAMQNVQAVHEAAADYAVVEKRAGVTRDEFIERYVHGCRPVVLTDIARDWPAMQRWSFAEFKRRYGSMTVQVQAGRDKDADFEVNKIRHRRDTNFAAFLDRVAISGITNDEYLTANNELLRRPDFAGLLDDVGPLPDFCDGNLRNAASLWVGPAGTRTPLHHDTLMLLHTQIVGRKRWRFVSPLSAPRLYNDFDVYSPVDFESLDLERFPEAANVKVLDVVVEPGETVFLPLAWWHQVTSLDKCISLSFTNLDVPNKFDFGHPP
jgi:hypothetical protein